MTSRVSFPTSTQVPGSAPDMRFLSWAVLAGKWEMADLGGCATRASFQMFWVSGFRWQRLWIGCISLEKGQEAYSSLCFKRIPLGESHKSRTLLKMSLVPGQRCALSSANAKPKKNRENYDMYFNLFYSIFDGSYVFVACDVRTRLDEELMLMVAEVEQRRSQSVWIRFSHRVDPTGALTWAQESPSLGKLGIVLWSFLKVGPGGPGPIRIDELYVITVLYYMWIQWHWERQVWGKGQVPSTVSSIASWCWRIC